MLESTTNMDSDEPETKDPNVERFMTLLRRNLMKPEMDARVDEIRKRAKRKRLERDLETRKN